MRNCIRNILTYWRNILGKKLNPFPPFTGFPYSFAIDAKTTNSIEVRYISTDKNTVTYVTYTPNGETERTIPYYNSNYGFSANYNNLLFGSTFTIDTGAPIVEMTINGFVIIDNE